MSFAIVVDSTLDMREEFLKHVNIVPLKVIIGEEVFKDRELTNEKLFKISKEKGVLPKTSQPSPDDFKPVYEKLLEDNDFVVSLHLSEKLSGTIQSARMAAESIGKKDRVLIFDITAPSIIADPYVELLLGMEGASMEEIRKELENLRERTKFYLTVNSLDYLKASGRLSGIEALIGSLLKLRPVIEVLEGELHVKKITRGKNGPLNFFKKAMENMGKRFVIGSILNENVVKELAKHAENLGKPYVIVESKSAVLAAHLGPGSFGVVFID